ncbi:MAG: S8 family serine peptidase [Burkholderiaceae bacterium]
MPPLYGPISVCKRTVGIVRGNRPFQDPGRRRPARRQGVRIDALRGNGQRVLRAEPASAGNLPPICASPRNRHRPGGHSARSLRRACRLRGLINLVERQASWASPECTFGHRAERRAEPNVVDWARSWGGVMNGRLLGAILFTVHFPIAFGSPILDEAVKRDIQESGLSRVIVEKRSGADGGSNASAVSIVQTVLRVGRSRLPHQCKPRFNEDRSAQLDALAASPLFSRIVKGMWPIPALLETVQISGASETWSMGIDGTGVTVAILDTGIDPSHPAFENRIVAQACFSVQDDALSVQSLCPNGAALPTGDSVEVSENAATGCGSAKECSHGTHVAGIIAGREQPVQSLGGKVLAGVARSASIFPYRFSAAFFSRRIARHWPRRACSRLEARSCALFSSSTAKC